VYGSIDGTVTTFAVIAGTVGAQLSPSIILILGVSNVLADGFSMAAGNFLSERSKAAQTGDRVAPLHTAFATFVAFVVVGCIPLFAYFLNIFFGMLENSAFAVSAGMTALSFLSIGYIRGAITKEKPFVASLETFAVGSVAALVAYSVGAFIKTLV
jgi:VIT1/CCC1 family predicted Fe2+/Mn2+ transporter